MGLALVSHDDDDDDESNTTPAPRGLRRSVFDPIPARYEVGECVGRGGMGEVMSARDLQIGRDVAIKRMRAKRPSDRAVQRFLREARVQGRLDHPAIVPVHELGHDADGVPYFVMKKLTGATLSEGLCRMPEQRLLRALVDIALAVEFAHTRGVVHRDLKPTNLVLGDFGEVYVLDWGIAKIVGEDDDGFGDAIVTDDLKTRTGAMLGTPGYMAPEQIDNASDVDDAADVYSLGCILFEIVAGMPLHPTKRAAKHTLELVEGRPSARGATDVPPELDDLCARATARDRSVRPTARELADGIQRFLDGDRDVSLRRQLAEAHLARAHAAFARAEDPAQRAIATREASSALALDPMLAGAAELLGRLMLEPPSALPREVEQELELESSATNRSQARIAMWICLGYFGFTPFLIGYRGTHLYAALYFAYIVLNVWLVWRRAHGCTSFLVTSPTAVAIRNAILVAVIAHVFSPLILAPGLAAVTTSALLISPLYAKPRAAAVLLATMVSAIALPWLAEATGLVTRTLTITDSGAILHNPEILGNAMMRGVGWTGYTIGLVAAAVAIAAYVRRNERDSRGRVHLQAWHLRALVPASRAEPPTPSRAAC
jgi:serine/threonine-protein kinase